LLKVTHFVARRRLSRRWTLSDPFQTRFGRRTELFAGLGDEPVERRAGSRPRRVQTAEGELAVEIPQVREAAEPFVSKLFPRGTKLVRT
jgi:hypothetical protein